ncbi:hypothetical protein [Pseudaminobacter sp. NGMCC 1.201702]|uniref:hypothetical protein n=1 Tax=Pseudaminobacter sp. NGMCC 1.201702 TaxID=3391825 RepID=UPI0039EEA202
MLDTKKVRGGNGLAPIDAEVDEILDDVFNITKEATESFFNAYNANPNPRILATWLETRAWREIDYVFLLNEQIRRYGLRFRRDHITLLAKQSFQEAEHYEEVGKAVESLGGTVPTSVPTAAVPWSNFLWECMDRHHLAAIAAWYVSETSASGSFEPTFKGAERQGHMDVVRIYKQIEIDEKFHTGLGRQVLSTYAETDQDREEILRAMRGMRDIAWKSFTPEVVAATMRAA